MSDESKKDEPKVQADNKSVAVGSISVGGSTGDINIHAGDTNIYQFISEDDVPFTSEELEKGLTRFAEFLPEHAPVLQEKFSPIAKKMRATLGADLSALSPTLKKQREDTVDEMKLMCVEVLDISFRALCTGQKPPPYDSRPPFLGLFAFKPEDKEFYFGREALIQKLATRLKEHPFLAVMGASGSGKSSLVMAGLIPALEAQISYLTPSDDPLARLHEAQEKSDQDTVYVVDQFEELFTLTHVANAREAFIQELLTLTKTNRVVVTMRADFWGEVATHKDLKQAMQDHQELIAPMDTAELHFAMEQQAAAVGLRFDSTLSETILEEVKGEPGAMPLLQHALWMLWKRRHGLYLKAEEYQAFGGVKQAIASTAEDLYASCSDFERDRIQNIFLRLTRLDDSGDGRDTRRRVMIGELFPAKSDPTGTIQLLNKLADARLIVKTDKEVEVAHEALIRHWSRLTHWLNDDRDNLRLREGVSEDAREWEKSNHDESLLNHRGGRLELALAMSKNSRYQLNPIEQAYLDACVEIRERARIGKEEQQQRELEGAKKQVKIERRIRMVTTGILVITLILVGVLSYNPIHNAVLRQQAMGSALIPIPRSDVILGDIQNSDGKNQDFLAPTTKTIGAFNIEVYEVTNKRYLLCVNAGKCSFPLESPSIYSNLDNANLPVVSVTAIQASQFCEWLDRKLPTELEWERAARFTDGRPWPWGKQEPNDQLANFYYGNEGSINSVGQYNNGKSQEGVFDLAGNVWEWTRSAYSFNEPDWEKSVDEPPISLSVRGGDFQTSPQNAMSGTIAYRYEVDPYYGDPARSFRCVSH